MLQTPTAHFIRHYLEMVIAMLLGMAVLGIPGFIALEAAGVDTEAAGVLLWGMALSMTVPMVAWMRHRGHGWAPAWEMTASMFVPSFAAIALLAGGLVEDSDTLLAIQHVAMFPGMLVAMLLRRGEYTGHAAHAVA
jgi:hypothetical protein